MVNETTDHRIVFVTGRLAEASLRQIVAEIAERAQFSYEIQVLPITVAALMTPEWIARNVAAVDPDTDLVLLPGYCHGDLTPITEKLSSDVQLGPKDLRQLPRFFGEQVPDHYGDHNIEILAEINHAPRLDLADVVTRAQQLRAAGADVIDVGCDPGHRWSQVAECVRALRDQGLRVSIDSFDSWEVAQACESGAELVLSVNKQNRDAAAEWDTEVVAIPDTPDDLASLEQTVEVLEQQQVAYRLDPILEPIGCGFANSLVRYAQTRERYPSAEIMMGIGNLTELSDCDSAGVNLTLLGICQELRIHSVLTTQVINWAQTSVRECDVARRLSHYAVSAGVPPKNLDERLVMLRDARPLELTTGELQELQRNIRDNNLRVFLQDGQFHLITSQLRLANKNPFKLFAEFLSQDHPAAQRMDARHAFYLGYEMCKAVTARTLGKQYTQDEPLDWGLLTEPEK